MVSPIQFLSFDHPFSLSTLLIIYTLLCVVDFLFFLVVFLPFPVSVLFVFFFYFVSIVYYFFFRFSHCLVADVLIFSNSMGCVCVSLTHERASLFLSHQTFHFFFLVDLYFRVAHQSYIAIDIIDIASTHTLPYSPLCMLCISCGIRLTCTIRCPWFWSRITGVVLCVTNYVFFVCFGWYMAYKRKVTAVSVAMFWALLLGLCLFCSSSLCVCVCVILSSFS